MRAIMKILAFLLSILLVFSAFFLAGSGQETYFYAACGFGLSGILVFIMFMREKKGGKAPAKGAGPSGAAPEKDTEVK